MAVISEVKCGRCDRKYSGFRSRCPYCGARRNKRGKHADEPENNAKARLIVGVLLLAVLIVATMILIITNIPKDTSPTAATKSPGTSAAVSPKHTDSEISNTSIPGTAKPSPSSSAPATASASASASSSSPAQPSASGSPSPSVDPNAKIASVSIIYNGAKMTDVTMKVGDSLDFKFSTTPVSSNKVPIWDSADPTIASVTNGKVLALSKGTTSVTCTVDGIPAKCVIRVK